MGGASRRGGAATGAGSASQPARQTHPRGASTPRGRTYAEASASNLGSASHNAPHAATPSPPSEASSSPGSAMSGRSTPSGQPPRPPTSGGVLPTPRGGRVPATPRSGGGGQRPSTPATLPLIHLPHARQAFIGSGPASEPAHRPKTPRAGAATPRGAISIPLLRLGGDDGAAAPSPRGPRMPSPRGAQQQQQRLPARTPRGRGGRSSNHGDRSAGERPGSANSGDGQNGRIGSKRGPQSSDSESTRLEQEALRKRGAAWKQQQHADSSQDTAAALQRQQQENVALQAKVAEARGVTGGELQGALVAAVLENERLNKQLHGLHNSAAALRQAIADARSLQMHLQQEAADARLLAVGLQAQLRDAESQAAEAGEDSAVVRAQGVQLVCSTAAMFGLSPGEVFGAGSSATAGQPQANHAGGGRRSRDGLHSSLDARSFSLLQNAHALLAHGGDNTGHSPQAASLPHQAAQSPQRHGGSSGSAAAEKGPSARQGTPGCGVRIAADPEERSADAHSSPQHTPPQRRRQSRGSGQQHRPEAQGNDALKPTDKEPAEAASPAADASPAGSNASASSRLALRIASMHEKFAAATNLLDADSSVEASSPVEV